MRDDDLRKRLRDWDPAERRETPGPELLARIRQRREGGQAPEWRRRSWIVRGWMPAAAACGAALFLFAVAWGVLVSPEVEEPPVRQVRETREAPHAPRPEKIEEAVQVVYTASNGVRIYWQYKNGS